MKTKFKSYAAVTVLLVSVACSKQHDKSEDSSKDFFRAINLRFKVSKSYFNISLNELEKSNDSLAVIYLRESVKADSFNLQAREMLTIVEAASKAAH